MSFDGLYSELVLIFPPAYIQIRLRASRTTVSVSKALKLSKSMQRVNASMHQKKSVFRDRH